MITLRPALAVFAVATVLVVASTRTARAQGHTPDPYNIVGEYNRQYEPYMYATVPNMPGILPNQNRLTPRSGLRSANQFQSAMDGDEDEGGLVDRGLSSRSSGPGVPYYRANRQFDKEFQRNYRPNDIADRAFYANQQQRNEKYFQALRETDTRKRAQLLREYNLENLRNARSMSANRNLSDRERNREMSRDKFGPGGLPLNADDEPSTRDARRPSAGSAAGVTAPAPSTVRGAPRPLPRNRSLGAPPAPSTLRGRTPAPVAPRRAGASTARDRTELLDRARTAVTPRSTTPAPSAPSSR